MAATGIQLDMEAQLKSKQLEARQLQAKVQEVRLQAQQLRIQLQAMGAQDTLVPCKLQAGGTEEPSELRALLEWLVGAVDLQRQVIFECGCGEGEVQVGGRRVTLNRMVTWQMGDSLKLSVPLELQAEIAGMLSEARQRGLEEASLRLAKNWELLGAEVVSNAGSPEPAIFLVHRGTSQAVVIAKWPSVDFTQLPAGFDPESHFLSQKTPNPDGPDAATSALTISQPGDRVEVEYEGHWFTGTLQSVDGDIVNVVCDVDSPGVITVAPITAVRPARPSKRLLEDADKKLRHMRARSIG
ncbi:RPL3 [Symbiodinium pilosum]|uniref:RPL3 protein n=1 Tax=Symbiodinium pilosum TaxID=2952 RepID=A0A812SKR3_SYMPI|nr:RPL3 [Symbiodinium pilosum]